VCCVGGEDVTETEQAASRVVQVVGGADGASLADKQLTGVLGLQALNVDFVVGVSRQAPITAVKTQ
jgi:hypothetical protein